MATIIRDIDRVLTMGGNVVADGQGRIAICRNTGGLSLELQVIGTHFPSLSIDRDDRGAVFVINNADNTDGFIDIDYADGTGWHNYTFKTNGSNNGIRLARKRNNQIDGAPTPSNISQTGVFNYPVYFYEDLPLPAGTVDDFYNHPRTITIRFDKFADLMRFFISFVGLYGVLPEAVGRFRNLNELTIQHAYHLTGADSDLGKVFGKILSLQNLGFEFGNQVPDFVLESPTLETIQLSNMMDLSGDPVSTRLDDFLSSAYLPNLNSFNLTGCRINYQLPDLQNNMTGAIALQSNGSPLLQLSPDLSKWQCSNLALYRTKMTVAEYQRILENGLMQHIQLRENGVNVDYDLTVNNTTLTSIDLADTYGGFFPTFLSKLTALETLQFWVGSVGITDWGTAGVSPTLLQLYMDRMPNLTPIVPSWLANLTNLFAWNSWCWQTQSRIDTHLESFYVLVESNSPMTGSGVFRGLDYRLVDNVLSTNVNPRPSGTYQQPTGYIQGSNNGSPTTPMEWIWVLVHQYDMIVRVLNSAGNGIDILTP